MNKTQLIRALAGRTGVTQAVVREVVDALFDPSDGAIAEALNSGDGVTISGFGVFTVMHRKARLGRNPRTGAPVHVPPTRAAVFRPAPALKARVAGDA